MCLLFFSDLNFLETWHNTLCRIVLYCTVLHCGVLYYTLLYFTVLYCTLLYFTVLYCTLLYFTVLYCTLLYFTVLNCTLLYFTVLYCTLLYCTVLYCTVLHCKVLYCTLQEDQCSPNRVNWNRNNPDIIEVLCAVQGHIDSSKYFLQFSVLLPQSEYIA